MHNDSLPLKPEDRPHVAADDLQDYFRSAAYRQEVKRQRASQTTRDALNAAFADYWATGQYSHAANLAR